MHPLVKKLVLATNALIKATEVANSARKASDAAWLRYEKTEQFHKGRLEAWSAIKNDISDVEYGDGNVRNVKGIVPKDLRTAYVEAAEMADIAKRDSDKAYTSRELADEKYEALVRQQNERLRLWLEAKNAVYDAASDLSDSDIETVRKLDD